MLLKILVFVELLSCAGALASTKKEGQAFVSTLLSNDFLLAARVLAHNLQQLHPERPLLILYTDGVNNHSIERLEQHPNVQLREVERIDTPQLATHRAKKFQYTKINLWSLTDYESLIYIDLDTILVDRLDELFECGRFCASLRHSDAFNTGVMVIKPNFDIYLDMLNKTSKLDSYDGGDQGFLNSYFWELKFASMFRPNSSQPDSTNIQRLSAAYNYDVGMYYLSGRQLVKPKLIHFTMLFVKPWHWYGYPLFDLNWSWLSARISMERTYHKLDSPLNLCLLIKMLLAFSSLIVLFEVSVYVRHLQVIACLPFLSIERKVMPIFVGSTALWLSLKLTPMQLVPHIGWCLFTVNFSLILSLLTAAYSRFRFNSSHLFWNFFLLLLSLTLIHSIGWHSMIRIQQVTQRIGVAVLLLVFYATSLYHLLGFLVYDRVEVKCKRRFWTGKWKGEETDQLTCVVDGS